MFGLNVGGLCETNATFAPGGPDSWGGCWPGLQNTGVSPDQNLTVVSGNQTYGPSYNGQTISNQEFRGFVTVTGGNITFVNCWFRGGTAPSKRWLLDSRNGSNTVVIDSTFAPMNPSVYIDGVIASNTTLERVDISGTVDGVKASDNVIIRNSYIRDMSWFASDPDQGGGSTHNDGVQILNGSNIQLIHNTITPAGQNGSNAAVQITQDFGAVGSVLIEKNYVDYGGCTLNVANKPLSSLSGVSIIDNRFGHNQGFNNCTIKKQSGVTFANYTGNLWGDNDLPIPPT